MQGIPPQVSPYGPVLDQIFPPHRWKQETMQNEAEGENGQAAERVKGIGCVEMAIFPPCGMEGGLMVFPIAAGYWIHGLLVQPQLLAVSLFIPLKFFEPDLDYDSCTPQESGRLLAYSFWHR